MLLLSLLLLLAGTTLLTAAGIMITYIIIAGDEKNLLTLLSPGKWPPSLRKWARHGGAGLVCVLFGMAVAAIAT